MGQARNRGRTGRQLAILGSVVTALAAPMAWLEIDAVVLTVVESGFAREGWLTLMLAIDVIAIVYLRPFARHNDTAVVVCGGLITVVASAYVLDLALGYEVLPTSGLLEEVGREFADLMEGVYVTLVGGLLVLVGGALWRLDTGSGPPQIGDSG